MSATITREGAATATTTEAKRATIYRMVMPKHICPWGLRAVDLLEREGFEVDDRWLKTREETDAFKAEHHVETTPQTFVDGKRVGGYDDLRRFLGKSVADPKAVTYKPVVAIFAMAALIAVAVTWALLGTLLTVRTAEWLLSIAMCLLAVQKLRDVEGFATMFLGYDLLAQRWVRYAYLYPFGEALAGVLMLAGAAMWLPCRSRCSSARSGPSRCSRLSTSRSAN